MGDFLTLNALDYGTRESSQPGGKSLFAKDGDKDREGEISLLRPVASLWSAFTSIGQGSVSV
jgi:hypothetical protein